MEQMKYNHHFYSEIGIDSFPPIFKAGNIREVLDFRTNAITEIRQAAMAAVENSRGVAKFFFNLQHHPQFIRLQHTPLYRFYDWLNTNPNRFDDSNLCFFAIQEAYHWPINDPVDKTRVSLSDIGKRFTLETKQPSVSDIILLSPFAANGSYFSWEAVREVSWHGKVALKAAYAQRRNQTEAKYSLIYISESDDINRKGHHLRPIDLVSRKRAVIEGVRI
ncbi:hypothetical protein HYU94_02650 [Candidatus Daviesbacteria bacterium]|nr:hypothetical protein [Candidatus Daviesbacteria bacterium]